MNFFNRLTSRVMLKKTKNQKQNEQTERGLHKKKNRKRVKLARKARCINRRG